MGFRPGLTKLDRAGKLRTIPLPVADEGHPPWALEIRSIQEDGSGILWVGSSIGLYRFDPRRIVKGEAPLKLDYGPPKVKVAEYMRNESRFRMIERADPARYKGFVTESQAAADRRYSVYEQLAGIKVPVIQAKEDEQTRPDVMET